MHRHTHRLYCMCYDSSYYFHFIFFSSVSIGGGCPDEVGGGGFGICPRDCLKNSDCSQNNSLCCPAACGGHRCLVRCPKLTCSKACSTGYTLVNNCPTCICKGEQAFLLFAKKPLQRKESSLYAFIIIIIISIIIIIIIIIISRGILHDAPRLNPELNATDSNINEGLCIKQGLILCLLCLALFFLLTISLS